MKAYSAYKPSRLRWVERLPATWTECRARYLFRAIDERSDTGKEELLSVSHLTGVTPRSEKNVTMFLAETYEGHKLCAPGDVVINSLWAWMAALGVSRYRGIVSSAYHVYRQRDPNSFNPKFLDYLLRTSGYAGEYLCRSKGVWTSRLLLTPGDFFNIPVIIPPRPEQDAIVAFLEAKEAEIQKFNANQRRRIELLEDYKAVTGNTAVTRGFRAPKSLRDSGISWLGKIPNDWIVAPLRRYCNVVDCKHLTVPFVDEGIPLASVVEAQSFDLKLDNAKRTTRRFFETLIQGGRKPGPGDIIYCRNTSVGAAAYVSTCEEFAMGQDVCLIKPLQENGRFINYVINSRYMEQQLGSVLVGATIKRINVAEIRALCVAFPPRLEQDEIVTALDSVVRETDMAVASAEQAITTMEEYRTALISAAVTGKIDVRNM